MSLSFAMYRYNRASVACQKAPEGKTARVTTTAMSGGQGDGTAGQGQQDTHGGNSSPGRGGSGGHYSPTKLKCYACGGRGHFARVCPSIEGGNRGGARGGSIGGYRGYRRGDYQIRAL